jgi:aspartyl-tRNA(Asn)/glutamyl-tRNA(Gln) amidotransferase subunit B
MRTSSVRPIGAEKNSAPVAEIKNVELLPLRREGHQLRSRARQIDVDREAAARWCRKPGSTMPDKGETRSMRSKEEANDYRCVPDPDLLPVELDESFIEAVRQTLRRALPDEKADRFCADYGLSRYDALVLTSSRDLADYYEAVVRGSGGAAAAKLAANWVMGDFSGALNRDNADVATARVECRSAGRLCWHGIQDDTISGKIAEEVFEAMWAEGLVPMR